MTTALFEVLPLDLQKQIEGELLEILKRAAQELGAAQALICFIQEQHDEEAKVTFRDPSRLWIRTLENIKLAILPPDVLGLTGWSASRDLIGRWPGNANGSEYYFSVDPRVTSEIVAPIHLSEAVTGVLLFDSAAEGRTYQRDDEKLVDKFRREIEFRIQYVARLSDEDSVRHELGSIAAFCYERTLSARGYVGVKRWDGLFEYFKVGEGKEVFLELSPQEGLCGKVMRTGNFENPKVLLDDPDYIPSDPLINSEIICPILDQGEIVGIINMESYAKHAYDATAERLILQKAEDAAEFTHYYRTPADAEFGYAFMDLYESLMNALARERRRDVKTTDIFQAMQNILAQRAKSSLKGLRCECWLRENPPDVLSTVSVDWESASKGGSAGWERLSYLYAPVLLDGDPKWIVVVEREGIVSQDDLMTLKALCRIASRALDQWGRERRAEQYIDLLQLMISSPDESITEHVVRSTCDILESDHCTLFVLLEFDGRSLFVPGASTAVEIQIRSGVPAYTAAKSDGLTGWVAETRMPLRVRDVQDRDELNSIDPMLEWKGRLSETFDQRCRSLMAFPIFHPQDSGQMVGILRTHRDSRSRRPGYTDEHFAIMRSVAQLLSAPVGKYFDRVRPRI